MKKNLTLGQWLIEKTDGEAYRAGKLHGEKHPEVDQRLINKIGNLKKLLSQAREMEKDPELKGLIRFDWRDMGNDIRTIHYSVEIIPLLCDKEGIEDPRKRQQRYIEKVKELLQEASQLEIDWLKSYYRSLSERLEQGKLVKEMEDEAWFVCLNAIAKIPCPIWKRVFSARVFRDSKRFQTTYEDRVVKVLREYSEMPDKDVMTNEQILKVHGIISYTQTLEWKGAVICRTDTGQTFDTGDFPYGAVLNSQTMEHAKPVDIGNIQRIMTIENKANYENMSYREDTLYIYCHGFFSPKEVEFLQELAVLASENVEFLHWGDMDYGESAFSYLTRRRFFPN
ncbi:MAG: Wadjet anti-phage system protein JetD domain-containing protein [Christensenellales bacterium]